MTEVSGNRVDAEGALGNRSFGSIGRVSGVPGNRDSRRTGSEVQAASGNRRCRSIDEFKAAPGDRGRQEVGKRIQGTPGNWSFAEAPGDRRLPGRNRATGESQRDPGNRKSHRRVRFAQGNGYGTRAGSGSASSQASGDGGIGKLGSGSRSQFFEKFGQKGAKSRKGLRPLRFS